MYAYVENGEIVQKASNLPRSWKNVSNFYLLPQVERESLGWYEVTDLTNPAINLDQRYGDWTYTVSEEGVSRVRSVITMDLQQCKDWLKERAKNYAEMKLQEEHSLLYLILGISGKLGASYKSSVETSIENWINAYMAFAGEVDACATKAQLLVVYNNYPVLQGDVV